jgi:hypothetical protein
MKKRPLLFARRLGGRSRRANGRAWRLPRGRAPAPIFVASKTKLCRQSCELSKRQLARRASFVKRRHDAGNLSADCRHLVERAAVPPASPARPGALSPSAGTDDPPHTGTVKTSAKVGRQGKPLAATSLPRPSRVAARSRAHQAHARRPGRAVRWVVRRHPPGVDDGYYPRVAYTPWWAPSHSWYERNN